MDLKEFKAFQKPKKNKYKNIPVVHDGITFQSTKEGNYYLKLKLLLLAKEATAFTRQNRYKLKINNVLICTYTDDFRVMYSDGRIEVIDVKGLRLPIYNIKKRLMKELLGIEIIEK